ncbi:uncharacterized protein [Elaeis guineensis]|uniref:uncharacterized protein n=1 Tax=Elaeis guineensis var. tenera TaxID=51953 RepID=UPI003C6D2565
MVHDACAFINTDVERDNVNEGYEPQEPNPEAVAFYRLLKDADKNLYPGCDKISKLSFAVKLLHLKCSNNWSDTSMDKLLKVFKEVLPNGALVPNSFYEAKKLIQDLRLEHIKIDACLNDCVIYWREHANAIVCPVYPRSVRLGLASDGFQPFGNMSTPHRTVLDIKEKTKDTLKGHFDLVDMNIRHNLHPYIENDKLKMPVATYTLSPQEKIAFCNFLSNLRVPDGFSSNISRCVNINEKKISGLKCHDHHILLQQIISVAIRGLLPKSVYEPLIELSNFFRNICSKSLKVQDLKQLEDDIVMTLCKLETIFPPAFFEIMIHLPIHLASEAKIGGPVQYRWMYPVERYLRTLKSYVRNKARPEGSIARGYLANECLTFCSRYLNSVETKFNRVLRNDDRATSYQGLSIFVKDDCAKGAFKSYELNVQEFTQAQAYVLRNCEEVWPYIEEHKKELEEASSRNILARHHKEFSDWFYERVSKLKAKGKASEDLLSLAVGLFKIVHRYGTYIVNRFRFHARDRVIGRKSQNSGVLVKGDDTSADKEYYEVLKDIFELFVNIHGSLNTNEPFVLASQAEQVFYVEDLVDSNWLVVVKTYPRDAYDVPSVDNDADDDDDDDSLIEDDVYQQEK